MRHILWPVKEVRFQMRDHFPIIFSFVICSCSVFFFLFILNLFDVSFVDDVPLDCFLRVLFFFSFVEHHKAIGRNSR